MEAGFYFFVFILGAVVGSFLNVVVLRYNTGETLFKRGSRCFSCNKTLGYLEMVPVFSFLIQGGRCKKCNSKISIQYPLVEFLTGLLFVLVFWKFGFSLVVGYWLLVICLLVIISVYDFKHKIIPNKVVWLFNLLAFLYSLFIIHNSLFISYFLSGLGFAAFFALLWFFSKGSWMGFGDAKLALGLGWFLGPEKTILAFLFSFWLGGIISIILLILKKSRFSMKSEIPFAPFLVAGSLLALFLDISFNILSLIF